MLQRSTANDRSSTMAMSRIRQAKPEDGLSRTPGELVPADKVDEVLHGLDLPQTVETEEAALPAGPEDYEGAPRRTTSRSKRA